MHVEVALSGSVLSVEALARFLRDLERLVPVPIGVPKAIRGNDGVIYCQGRICHGGGGMASRGKDGGSQRRDC